jgi:hypothetical protein
MVVSAGCTPTIEGTSQDVSGTYSGSTANGKSVVLTLVQRDYGFSGHGVIAGTPVAISGVPTWRGTGTVTSPDGTVSSVTLSLSADNAALVLEPEGGNPLTLERGGASVSAAPGPFSGHYRSPPGDVAVANVTVVQDGTLISGVGSVLGQTGGISGIASAADRAEGTITFADGSRASFAARLAADRRSIMIQGLGDPVSLVRSELP